MRTGPGAHRGMTVYAIVVKGEPELIASAAFDGMPARR
jgi:hypothetical protein